MKVEIETFKANGSFRARVLINEVIWHSTVFCSTEHDALRVASSWLCVRAREGQLPKDELSQERNYARTGD
jgi:hypothetical protein